MSNQPFLMIHSIIKFKGRGIVVKESSNRFVLVGTQWEPTTS